MADEENNRPRDWGHLKSPFFKLPPEIRIKVYRETFAGSKVDLVIDPPLSVNVVPVTGRRSIFSTVKSKHEVLLTCFQVYCEAVAIYWSLKLVRNRDNHFSLGYFLNRIPAIARPYIQHLRGVNLKPCRNWARRGSAWNPVLAESLDLFPNLKSCSVLGWSGTSATCTEAIARHPNVHFLEKESIFLSPGTRNIIFSGLNGRCPYQLERVSFKNLSSDRSLRWYQPVNEFPWLSDEAAFEMLMDPAPNEIESTTSHFESMTKELFESESELDDISEDDLVWL